MANILKNIIDYIYGVGSAKKEFEKRFPNEKILASDATKSIKTQAEKQIERGVDWVVSQRSVIILSDKRIKCGKFEIPLENIEKVEMLIFNTLFGKGQVLKVKTKDDENYQFGMQINPQWKSQNILTLTFANTTIKYSWFSIIVRVIIFFYILYWVYKRLA